MWYLEQRCNKTNKVNFKKYFYQSLILKKFKNPFARIVFNSFDILH